jgi:segregation and condensation protein A
MDYKIKLKLYEGPYELLYQLIKNSKINIYDISFVKIIDQYLEYINLINETNPEMFSNFILITSTLLEIKSKMLLPAELKNEKNEEDNLGTADNANIDEFYSKFEEYKKYKNIAYKLKEMETYESNVFYKNNGININNKNKLSIKLLVKSYKKYQNNLGKQYNRSKNFSIKQKVVYILKMLKNVSKVTFNKFIKKSKTKEEVISYLIAVLELDKRNLIVTYQSSNFDEILIKRGDKSE